MDGSRIDDLDQPVLDRAAALEQAAGDPDILRDVLQLVEESCTECLAAILAAAANREVDRLRQAAHRLKGSLVSVAAGPAGAAAAAVEVAARQEDLAAAQAAIPALEREIERLRPVLRELTQQR